MSRPRSVLLVSAAILLAAGAFFLSRDRGSAAGAEAPDETAVAPSARPSRSAPSAAPEPAAPGPALLPSAPDPDSVPSAAPVPIGAFEGGETIFLPDAPVPDDAVPVEVAFGDDDLAMVWERDPTGWEPPPVPPETLESIRAAFAAWRESDRSEEATATLRIALSGLSKEETLAVAASLMQKGSEQDRMDALWTVASGFAAQPGAEPTVRADADDEEGGGLSEEEAAEEEREAAETHDVIAIVGAGLEDPSPDVRDFALQAASSLSKDRADVLYSQVLCSDLEQMADLRRKLMSRIDGSSDPDAVNLFVQALQSPDAETAAAARKNLARVSGRAIDSVEDALVWLDEQEEAPSDPEAGAGELP